MDKNGDWSSGHGDSGSKDRATVALVDAKVDGLKELMRAEFGFIRERIAPLGSLVGDVSGLKKDVEDHEGRIERLESGTKGDREYRRVHLPSLIIAGIVAVGSITTTLITQLH
jgi:hypothetical protein